MKFFILILQFEKEQWLKNLINEEMLKMIREKISAESKHASTHSIYAHPSKETHGTEEVVDLWHKFTGMAKKELGEEFQPTISAIDQKGVSLQNIKKLHKEVSNVSASESSLPTSTADPSFFKPPAIKHKTTVLEDLLNILEKIMAILLDSNPRYYFHSPFTPTTI